MVKFCRKVLLFVLVAVIGVYAMSERSLVAVIVSERSLQETKAITEIPELCVLCGAWNSDCRLMDLNGSTIRTFSENEREVMKKGGIFAMRKGVGRFCYNFKGSTRYLLVSSSRKSRVYLWNFLSGEKVELQGHLGKISVMYFSSDGQHILTGSYDASARLWGVDGKCRARFEHDGIVFTACFRPNEQQVLTGSLDGTIRLSDFSGYAIETFQMPSFQVDDYTFTKFLSGKNLVSKVSFSPDGNKILAGSFYGRGEVYLWDLKEGSVTKFLGHQYAICTLGFSPDGLRILTGSVDGTARLFDLNRECIIIINHDWRCYRTPFDYQPSQNAAVDSLPPLDSLPQNAAVDSPCTSKYVDYPLLKAALDRQYPKVIVACFDHEGKKILTAAADLVKVSDLQVNCSYEQRFDGYVTKAHFSPDGKMVLISVFGVGLYLWDLENRNFRLLWKDSSNINCMFYF